MKEIAIQFFWKIAGIHPFFARIIAGFGFFRKHSYLNKTGWYRSFQKRVSINEKGDPIPWYSYPMIHFLETKALQSLRVFEFGCGNSSLWWSKQAKEVVSCEHHQGWYEKVVKSLPKNATCHLVSEEEYAQHLLKYKKEFDVIIIDGIQRVDCALNCLSALKEDGVVIWDDSHREEYKEGIDYLLSQGFKRLDFVGLGPIVMIQGATSIFYRSNNVLEI